MKNSVTNNKTAGTSKASAKHGSKKRKQRLVAALCGLGVGLVNGFFGGGGGMLAVPLLERVLDKPTKTAHATAILIILPISLFSALTYILRGSMDWAQGGVVTCAVIAGGIVGALLLSKLSNRVLRIIFYIIMLAAGIRLIIA